MKKIVLTAVILLAAVVGVHATEKAPEMAEATRAVYFENHVSTGLNSYTIYSIDNSPYVSLPVGQTRIDAEPGSRIYVSLIYSGKQNIAVSVSGSFSKEYVDHDGLLYESFSYTVKDTNNQAIQIVAEGWN